MIIVGSQEAREREREREREGWTMNVLAIVNTVDQIHHLCDSLCVG